VFQQVTGLRTGEQVMSAEQGKPPEPEKEHARNSLDTIPGSAIYSYNLDDTKTPGGLKVRWKVRVVTGPAAARYDARQNQAIRELLTWAARHQTRA
jgi:hypothetical protein